ncbi:MAG: tetratricopeptide repeat protein [Bacteroidales bacterium]|nr:tetratricopeptide repeat protein [Bacteroidales bacterium]
MNKLFRLLILQAALFAPQLFAQEADSTAWVELYNQGLYYRQHSNSYRALQSFEQAYELHPSDTLRRELALTYYNRGRYQQSIELCRSLLYPDSLDSDLHLMALSFEKMEQLDSALNYQMLVAERNIENYNNLASLCNTLINAQMTDLAIGYLDRYCAIDSTNTKVNSVRAYALHKAGRHKEAIAEYRKLIAEGDNRNSTHYYMGLSCFFVDDMGEAYNHLYRVVEQSNRQNASALARFGAVEVAIHSGNIPIFGLKESEGGFDPTSPLGQMFASHTDYTQRFAQVYKINKQGVNDIQEAVELMQPNKELLFYLYNHIARHMMMRGSIEEAIKWYKKSSSILPDRPNNYYHLASCYHILKDYRNELRYHELYLEHVGEDEDPANISYAKECISECKKVLFMKTE